MKKLVKESLNEIIGGPAGYPLEFSKKFLDYEENQEKIFSKYDVAKILKSIIRKANAPGKLCGNLTSEIRKIAKEHNIKL